MRTSETIVGLVDLTLEAFFAAWLWPFMGAAAWRGYPDSPYARKLVNESRDLLDEIQGN